MQAGGQVLEVPCGQGLQVMSTSNGCYRSSTVPVRHATIDTPEDMHTISLDTVSLQGIYFSLRLLTSGFISLSAIHPLGYWLPTRQQRTEPTSRM